MRASCKHKFQMQQQQRRRIKLKSSQGSSSSSLPFFFFCFPQSIFHIFLKQQQEPQPTPSLLGAGQLCWPGRCGNRCLPTFWRTLLAKLLAYKLLICQKRRRLTVATNFHCLLWITPSNGISHKMQNKLQKKRKTEYQLSIIYDAQVASCLKANKLNAAGKPYRISMGIFRRYTLY